MKFIDTHAHLYLKEFEQDRDQMIQRAINSNVIKIILPNIDLASLDQVKILSYHYPGLCLPTIGLHPCDVKADFKQVLSLMENELGLLKYSAIGETGSDAYWDLSFWDEQIQSFTVQINWSKELQIPIIIHSRESIDQNIQLIKKHQDGRLKGVFHCFTGTAEQATQIMDLGFYLGVGGVVTYKKSDLQFVLQKIGVSKVVLETDAPFLSPVPNRGSRNESAYIPVIAKFLSESLEISLQEIARITTENASDLFTIPGS